VFATIRKLFRGKKSLELTFLTFFLSVKNFLAHHRFFVEPACGAALAATYFPEKYLKDLPIGDGPIINVVCGGNSVSYEMVSFWEENAKS
jgi:hypothetical protein